MTNPLRGEIWWCEWTPGRGAEQIGRRPSLVVQNDLANRSPSYGNTIVVAVSTMGLDIPAHIPLEPSKENGLRLRSYVKCEQIMTIEALRLDEYIGRVTDDDMRKVEHALRRVLGMR